MATEPGRARGEAGFTFVEVMAALVILSVGLLGLQALGIGAARAVTVAERKVDFVVTAERHVEAAVDSVRLGTLAGCGSRSWTDLGSGVLVEREIVRTGQTYAVTLTLRAPPASKAAWPTPHTVRTNAFNPRTTVC